MFVRSTTRVAAVGIVIALLLAIQPACAQPLGCAPPLRPFVPSDPRDVEAYADLIRQDFESYITDFSAYLRCLDAERARAFAEAQEVTAEYGLFSQLRGRSEEPYQFALGQSFGADPGLDVTSSKPLAGWPASADGASVPPTVMEAPSGWLGDLSPEDRLLLGAPQVVPGTETPLPPLQPTPR